MGTRFWLVKNGRAAASCRMQKHTASERSARLSARLDSVASTPGAEPSGLAFVAIEDGAVSYERYLGRRYIDPMDPARDLPVSAGTRFRLASISKPFVGVACMSLVEDGLLDLDADVSEYLGWRLRNPAYPDDPISPAMLLSHLSSIRDGGRYTLPPGRRLREFFEPGGDAWEGGVHFAGRAADRNLAPGNFYSYCNLGFGVMGTVIERLSGSRFDLYMRERVLTPLGVGGSFNVRHLSNAGLADLATLYRKGLNEDDWDYSGPWVPQIDDVRGAWPEPHPSDEEIAAYEPGVNATWLSPQGGLRASAREAARLALLFMGGGELDGARILAADSVAAMRRARWSFAPAAMNGDIGSGKSRRASLALFATTDSCDEFGGDRLRESGGIRMEGHFGDAYGLLGGLLFDVEARKGFVYLLGGTAVDPATRPGRFSSYSSWQENIHAAAVDYLYG